MLILRIARFQSGARPRFHSVVNVDCPFVTYYCTFEINTFTTIFPHKPNYVQTPLKNFQNIPRNYQSRQASIEIKKQKKQNVKCINKWSFAARWTFGICFSAMIEACSLRSYLPCLRLAKSWDCRIISIFPILCIVKPRKKPGISRKAIKSSWYVIQYIIPILGP